MAARKSGMATGTEVARISVKVSPDTSQFKRELKDKLEAIEKALGKDGAHTELDVDTDKAEKKVEKSTQRMSRRKVQVKTEVQKIDTDAIAKDIERSLGGALGKFSKFDVGNRLFWDPKEGAMAAKVAVERYEAEQKAIAESNKLLEGRNKLIADAAKRIASGNVFLSSAAGANLGTDQARQIAAMKKKMDILEVRFDKKVMNFRLERFKPSAEIAQARAEMERVNRELDVLKNKANSSNDKLGAALQPDLKRFDPRYIRTKLREYGFLQPIKIEVEADFGDGAKLRKQKEKLQEGKGRFGNIVSALTPNFGTGVNPAGYAAILGGILLVAQPLLGIITASLTALPGLISLVMAPIAAITLGLDGFKKAAEAIKPQFDDLKNTMSAANEQAFTPVLKQLADEVFPRLKESLPGVSKGLADMSSGILDSLKGGFGDKLSASIERIGQAFTNMRPGVEGFTSGLIGLIDGFTKDALPGITEWFNKTGQDFKAWVTKMTTPDANGVSPLATAFQQLGGFIREVLSLLGEMAGKSMDFMATPGSLDGFIATFRKLGDVIQSVIDLSAQLNEKWQGLVQISRGAGIFTDLLTGDVAGAWNNAKDLFSNKPWNETQTQVDGVKNSLDQAGAAADANKLKVDGFLNGGGGGANAQRIRKGLAPIQGPGFNGDMPSGEAAAQAAPKVPVPDTSAAEAKLMEYQQTAVKTMSEAKRAIDEATTASVQPPDLGSFNQAFGSLAGVAQKAMQQVVDEINAGGQQAASAAQSVGQQAAEAMNGMAAQFQTVGFQMMNGVSTGIHEGKSLVIGAAVNAATEALAAAKNALGIQSPSRKFMEVGNYSMQGMAIGMEKGFSGVLAQATDMANKISEVFAADGDPTALMEGFSNKEVNRVEKALSFEMKRLNAQAKALDYQAKVTGNEALKSQAEGLRMRREELSLQKDMIDLTQEFADLEGEGKGEKFADSPLGKATRGLMDMPFDIGRVVGNQFMNDIGISGGGALGAIMDYGTEFAKQGVTNIFNTSNVDDTMALHFNQTNRAALGVNSR